MKFSRFLNEPSAVEVHVFFYPEGVKNSEPIPARVGKVTKVEDFDFLRVTFMVPEEYKNQITNNSEIVFALRLRLQGADSLYFPFPLHGKERYLGAKIKLEIITDNYSVLMTSLKQNESVKIETLQTLKTLKKW